MPSTPAPGCIGWGLGYRIEASGVGLGDGAEQAQRGDAVTSGVEMITGLV